MPLNRTSPLAVLAVLAVLVVAGCAVDQHKEVALYREVIDTSAFELAEQSGFDQPLTLEDALRCANRNNEQLAIEGENYLQALIDRKRAVANFLPTISLAPTYVTRDPPSGSSETGGGGSRNSRLDVPVTGEMNLFRGFSDVANLRATTATIEQRRALLLDVQQSLLIDVARTFFAILRAERSAEVLRSSIDVQEERVRDIRARLEAGFARVLDVAQTEAQASGTRVVLIRAQNDIRNGRELLELLTGVPVGDRALLAVTEVPDPLPPIESIESRAIERRQDLQAALASIEAARQRVQEALGQYWPSVSVNVSYFLSRESAPEDSDWTALFDANLPIFSAGLIEADVREAWSLLRQAKLDESFTRRRVIQEVRIAYENLQSSRRRLDELQVAVKAAQEALEQANLELGVGRGTTLERIVAQDQVLTAELALASEEFDYKIAYLNLLRSAGVMDDVLKLPAAATRPVE